MKFHTISRGLLGWLRQQQLYIAIALAVYAIFWAIQPQRADLLVTLIYSLLLCNLTVLAKDKLGILYAHRPFATYWLTYLLLLLVFTPVAVVLSTTVVYFVTVSAPRPPCYRF